MKRCFFIMLTALFCIGIFTSETRAAAKKVSVCNYASQMVYVAIGWKSYTIGAAKGWFSMNHNTCLDNLPAGDADLFDFVYAYAVGKNGAVYLPSTETYDFCINPNKAFEYSMTGCALAAYLFGGSANSSPLKMEKFGAMPSGRFLSLQTFHWDIR